MGYDLYKRNQISQYKKGHRTVCSKECGLAQREVWPLPSSWKVTSNPLELPECWEYLYSWWALQRHLTVYAIRVTHAKFWGYYAVGWIQPHEQSINQVCLHNEAPIKTLDTEAQVSFPGWRCSTCHVTHPC